MPDAPEETPLVQTLVLGSQSQGISLYCPIPSETLVEQDVQLHTQGNYLFFQTSNKQKFKESKI